VNFPFSNLSNTELNLTFSDFNLSLDQFELYEKCTKFDFETFNYSEFGYSDFDKDIDPDNNFYKDVKNKCHYYTDTQFIKKFNTNKGLNIIHFNARSLKANLDHIKNYLQNLGNVFDIIAITETWLDMGLIQMMYNYKTMRCFM
jgi:hypothetical protein